MFTSRRLWAVLALAAVVAVPVSLSADLPAASASPRPKLEVTFSKDGLTSLKLGGPERLAAAVPAVTRLLGATGPIQIGKPTVSFDGPTKVMSLAYPWGTVNCTYVETGSALQIKTTISNTGKEPISEIALRPLSLALLGDKQHAGRPTWCVEGPPMVAVTGEKGSALVAADGGGKPLMLSIADGRGAKTPPSDVPIQVVLGGTKLIVDDLTAARTIEPGKSDSFSLTLYLGGPAEPATAAGADAFAAYRQSHPATLTWKDRRPIFRMFTGGGLPKEQAIANLKDPDAVKPPAPDPKFQQQMMNKFKAGVAAAKAGDAQAMIFWDLEGDTFPHATTYIGDPRHIRLLNPQMDLIIDEAMKLYTDAGIRVGVTIRPSRVIYNKEKETATHSYGVAKDPFLELDGKVDYAVKRWGASVFYIDTNFFWRPYGPDKKWTAAPIPPDVYRRLHEKYPGVLFIPEIANAGDAAYTAPYGEARMGDYGVSEVVRAVWPGTFRVIVIDDVDFYKQFNRFVSTVRGGNALMTFASSPDSQHVPAVTRITQWAKLLDAGVPAEVTSANREKRLGLVKSPDAAVRANAVLRLADSATAQDAPLLASLVADKAEDWRVRFAATRTLAKTVDPKNVPLLLECLERPQDGLAWAATDALAKHGPAATEAVLARIETLAAGKTVDFRTLDLLGEAFAELDSAANEKNAKRLETACDAAASAKNTANVKRALINAIGRLGQKSSEPFLLACFASQDLRAAAAIALVRIDSQDGIALVKKTMADAKAAKDDNLAAQMARALRVN